MTRRRDHSTEAPGTDSFLDVVANLVGILIILVMVIGVRARDAMVEAETGATSATASAAIDVEAARRAARDAEANIFEIDQQVKEVAAEVERRTIERNQLQIMTLAAREKVEELKNNLNDGQRSQFEVSRQLADAQKMLHDLELQQQAAEAAGPPVGIIEHLPTPMAKTVLGREEHFRLLGGRLTYIPWDSLVEKLKAEAPQKVWKLNDAPTMTDTIGPEGGFLMRYTLARKTFTTPTKVGVAVRQGVELEKFVLVPVAENLGEPLQQALEPGSQFQARLSQFDPERTTLTVWVYPDSFDDFRALKQALFNRGFLTAARPLPEDLPIGGSPQGSRSAAQ
jgi:hypothetical protein